VEANWVSKKEVLTKFSKLGDDIKDKRLGLDTKLSKLGEDIKDKRLGVDT
jgi:hypothetical protein